MPSNTAGKGMPLAAAMVETPIGRLTLVTGDAGLRAILWPGDDPARVPLGPAAAAGDHPVLRQAADELGHYFEGARTVFTVPLDPVGTPFQRAVWAALMTIPYGETRSYGAIAAQIGRPGAARAVGAANARNPISIVTPCHRVIGSTGRLTGFAGGLANKARLLALEQAGVAGADLLARLQRDPERAAAPHR